MKSESMRLGHERAMMLEKITDNKQKIKQNKVLPYLVGNVVEVSQRELELSPPSLPLPELTRSQSLSRRSSTSMRRTRTTERSSTRTRSGAESQPSSRRALVRSARILPSFPLPFARRAHPFPRPRMLLDDLPPPHRSRSLGEAKARRSYRSEQGLVSHPRHPSCWCVPSSCSSDPAKASQTSSHPCFRQNMTRE